MAPETDARENRQVTWCQSHQFRLICQHSAKSAEQLVANGAPLGLCTVPGSSDADRIESKRSASIQAMGLCLRILGVSNGRMATENPDARQSLRSEAVHSAWDKHRASRKLAFA